MERTEEGESTAGSMFTPRYKPMTSDFNSPAQATGSIGMKTQLWWKPHSVFQPDGGGSRLRHVYSDHYCKHSPRIIITQHNFTFCFPSCTGPRLFEEHGGKMRHSPQHHSCLSTASRV
jgi:hypothetical protein